MTPYELRILLDVYVSGEISSVPGDAPIFKETVDRLLFEGWFIRRDKYDATPKLRCFLTHILALPDPVQKWSMPA